MEVLLVVGLFGTVSYVFWLVRDLRWYVGGQPERRERVRADLFGHVAGLVLSAIVATTAFVQHYR